MATKTIRQLNDDARSLLLEAKTIYDLGDDATPEQMEAAATKTSDAEAIVARLDKYGTGDALKTINRIENTISAFDRVDRPSIGGDGLGVDRRGRAAEIKTIGQQFVDSEMYRGWLKSVAPGGNIPERATLNSPPLEVKTLYTEAGDVSAGYPLVGLPDRRPEVVRVGWKPLVLRDLITNLTTTNDVVQVVTELASGRTNAAAAVLEATATSGNSVGSKPESAIAYAILAANVQTIAHWLPATSRILSDAQRLRGEIDTFLRMGIDQALENLMLNGNGTAPNFAGVNNTTGILAQAFVTNILITTRKALTNLKVNGLTMPTAFLFNPADWETIDLTVNTQGSFYFGGPATPNGNRLWGVPVVESMFQAAGGGLVANWSDAVIYDREQTTIAVSNSHNDFFIRNLVAILGEMRAAFHVRRPVSFCSVAFS